MSWFGRAISNRWGGLTDKNFNIAAGFRKAVPDAQRSMGMILADTWQESRNTREKS